jgi:hypothetical protein
MELGQTYTNINKSLENWPNWVAIGITCCELPALFELKLAYLLFAASSSTQQSTDRDAFGDI